ncbi:MOSC domain-containing protein [Halomonas sp. V046]|uniref:MOSC domain-containing protein n=1 Tax=Halomonas sp. V046 TaxID=3459611 RepID=UPI004044553E
MRITRLAIYPVKSLRGIELDSATLTERGLAFDRHWMLVDADGVFLTQRELPAMARIGVALDEGGLRLRRTAMTDLIIDLALPQGPTRGVRVWTSQCEALDEGDEAANWLNAALGNPREGSGGVRLVRFAPDHRRDVEADFLAVEEQGLTHTEFADGYPLLVASDASLGLLNERLTAKDEAPVPMSRFRPSLVVDGGEAFVERDWRSLQGPGYRLGIRKPCKRCKIITLDQISGEAPSVKEPLKTLVQMDTQPGWKGAYFGQNAIVEAGVGRVVRVGDELVATAVDAAS